MSNKRQRNETDSCPITSFLPEPSSHQSVFVLEGGKTATDLSDEIWFQVMQFCYGTRLGSISLDLLFRQLPHVSKHFHELCICYVQRIPQDLRIYSSGGELELVDWACRNRVKVGSFTMLENECSSLWMNVVTHLFRVCNIIELHTIDIERICNVSPLFSYELPSLPGIPASAIRNQVEDHHYFHSSLANVFADDTPALKKLTITIDREHWPHPLLEVVSDTLEELILCVCLSQEVIRDDQDLQYLTRMIQGMPKLKKLMITMPFPASFHIRSTTLEEIDARGCPTYFNLSECVCPSLKMITCMYYNPTFNFARPVVPFQRNELKFTHKRIEMEKDVLADCAHVEVGNRPFVGLKVPASCIIRYAKYI